MEALLPAKSKLVRRKHIEESKGGIKIGNENAHLATIREISLFLAYFALTLSTKVLKFERSLADASLSLP